jgi:hypothetical protein
VLKHIPAWFPFATFKRQALEWRKFTRAMVNRPFEMISQQMVSGTYVHGIEDGINFTNRKLALPLRALL